MIYRVLMRAVCAYFATKRGKILAELKDGYAAVNADIGLMKSVQVWMKLTLTHTFAIFVVINNLCSKIVCHYSL